MFQKEVYVERRSKLKSSFGSGLILIPGNYEAPMNYEDNCYPFIQDSTFLYFFGIDRAGLFGVIDIDSNKEYIFGTDFTIDDTIWMGPVDSLSHEALSVGVEDSGSIDELISLLKSKDNSSIYFTNQYRHQNMIDLATWMDLPVNNINDFASEKLMYEVAKLRNIKSDIEIIQLEKATNVTREMHLAAMKFAKPGVKEYEVAAKVAEVAKKYNATHSFFTICTRNGQTLHNHTHKNILQEGDLMLLDCGARLDNGYCGDMTTTIPVSKKYTDKQKDIYNLLIEMFDRSEELLKPGITYKEVHLETCKVLAHGMVKRGLMKGDAEAIVEAGAHALFMPHGLGHMIGLDVHDMENFGEVIVGYNGEKKSKQFGLASLRLGRVLEEGFTFTVEPGIYFIPELIKKWKDEGINKEFLNFDEIEEYLDFGGMRYEGDYLVTSNGSRRLGDKMPKYPEEIEAVKE